ncbi:probable BOI-related E3 ubiquitin-protein ligase 3 [Gastrolobium bilobum]|uniref:probable BOI-related E3 ubiquitin-protein ligase 3 n=1 Tax=Gastrolobium bilobum TaxID=150636 RepID=UPI002AB180CE|nr:probable BOI-related E3 ubiquitin-protein ligase 3 [Gastrolobium bilobum]
MAIQSYQINVGSSSNNGDYGDGLIEYSLYFQQKHQHQHQLEQRLGHVDPNLVVYNSEVSNSPNFAVQLEKDREEINEYIKFQDERLRFMLQEQGKQQVAVLLKIMEARSLDIMRDKEEEIAKATQKRVELEDFLKRLETEKQALQMAAQEKKEMVSFLYKTLEEIKASSKVVANEAESFCDEGRENKRLEDEGKGGKQVECGGVANFEPEVMLCKSCHSGRSCIVFLPCRHLCSCKTCDAILDACPVCKMPKRSSIETLLF